MNLRDIIGLAKCPECGHHCPDCDPDRPGHARRRDAAARSSTGRRRMKPPRYRTTEHAYGYEVMLLLADGRYVIYRRIGYYVYVVSLPGRIGSQGPQVCEALSGSGECLSAGPAPGSLAMVIRREARTCFARGNEPAYLIRLPAGQDR